MNSQRLPAVVAGLLLVLVYGCGAEPAGSLAEAEVAAEQVVPDGIDPRHPNVERSTTSIDFSGINTIRVELGQAEVRISQVEGNEAILKVIELISDTTLSADDYRRLLDATSVTAQRSFVDESRLDIKAQLPAEINRNGVLFQIQLSVPQGAHMEVLLDGGPVDISSIRGNVEVDTRDGEVRLDQIVGNAIVRTSHYDVYASDISGNLDAQTSDADIELRLNPPAGARISAETSDGTARIVVGNGTSAALNLSAKNGFISTNLNGFSVSDVVSGVGEFSATLNDGSGRIDASVTDGNIEFSGNSL